MEAQPRLAAAHELTLEALACDGFPSPTDEGHQNQSQSLTSDAHQCLPAIASLILVTLENIPKWGLIQDLGFSELAL